MQNDHSQNTTELLRLIREKCANGFGQTRPNLTRHLEPDVFDQHYYPKTVLMSFCRLHDLPVTGNKPELSQRINQFLRDGTVINPVTKHRPCSYDSAKQLTPKTQVKHFKADSATRAFLAEHIPNFKFSAAIQKWVRCRLANGDFFTYQDIIDQHMRRTNELKAAAKQGRIMPVTHSSCQMNAFYKDYANDKGRLKPHSHREAWILVRDSAGEKTYARYQDEITKIVKQLNIHNKP